MAQPNDPHSEQNFAGFSGFYWWIGVVENRKDPLFLGRVQVRIQAIHTSNLQMIPTKDLQWALASHPVNGTHGPVVPPKEGQWVWGYFMDGEHSQYPVIAGIYFGIPETTPPTAIGFSDQRTAAELKASPRVPASVTYKTDGSGVVVNEQGSAPRYPSTLNEPMTPRLARNESIDKTFVQTRKDNQVKSVPTADSGTWAEPAPGYAAVYPFNIVTETESGHIVEMDDTPGAERLSKSHRSGTFEEIQKDGTRITKVVKNDYEIIMSDKDVYIMGKVNITVQGDANIYVQKDLTLLVDGNKTETIKGNFKRTVEGNVTEQVNGDQTTTIDGHLTVKGNPIDLNP